MLEPATGYLASVRQLPFVDDAQIEAAGKESGLDGTVRIRSKGVDYRFFTEVKGSHLSYATADEVAARARRQPGLPWLVIAPYIGRPMARHLKELGLNFIDRLGNCWLMLGNDHVAEISGRTPDTPPEAKTLRAPAYRALFMLLAADDNVGKPVRELAELSGVSRAAVGKLLQRLDAEGFIGRTKSSRILLDRGELIDRFVHGYSQVLRPSMLIGKYEMQERDPEKFERRVEAHLGKRVRWAWSGLPAAYRLVPHYRGENSTLVIEEPQNLSRELKLIPATMGRLSLLRPAGPLTFDGAAPHTVNPLLVYAELLAAPHERTAEEAAELRERLDEFLKAAAT